MIDQWLGASFTELWLVVVSSAGIMIAAILAIRLFGLRTLSKMSSSDFVVTVGLGSVVGAVASSSTSLATGALAFLSLVSFKWVAAALRRRTGIDVLLDNTPLLLMDGSRIIDAHLDRAQVTRGDLVAKLREANVTRMDQVLAVVFEATGDISVLHGEGDVDPILLEGVLTPADTR